MKKLLLALFLILTLSVPVLAYEQPIELYAEEAAKGMAVGVYNGVPVVAIDTPYAQVDIGIQLSNKANLFILKTQKEILSMNRGYLSLHFGGSLFMDQANSPNMGFFIGTENYISAFTSLNFDIYPIVFGNSVTSPVGIIGVKAYL